MKHEGICFVLVKAAECIKDNSVAFFVSYETTERNFPRKTGSPGTEQNNGSCGMWNWVDLENCTSRYEIPWFYFSAICTDCVRTDNFDETNLIVE